MKYLVHSALALALLATPASAQKMGASNSNAPTVEQSIEIGDMSVAVNYTSISFGSGMWAKSLESDASKSRMRDRINQTATSSPLGSFETDEDVMVGGQKVAAGDYKLCFKLDDGFKWQLVLFNDDATVTIPLMLEKAPQPSKRLVMALHAGDEDGTAAIWVGFGDENGLVAITPAGGGDDDDDDDGN